MAAKCNNTMFTIIPDGKTSNDIPTLKELHQCVREQYACQWDQLGLHLGLEDYDIANISKNNENSSNRVVTCCTAVLEKWLKKTSSPTWGMLRDAIMKLPIKMKEINCTTGVDVLTARNHLCNSYIQGRFNFGSDEWPPYHPKHYTTLSLIHYKGGHTDAKVIAVTKELANKGNILTGKFLKPQLSDRSKTYAKDISEIFAPGLVSSNPNFFLIEGAPGIGKTVLSKEIAYQWAIDGLLKDKMLVFLLFLRDPNLKKICLIEDLIRYIFKTTELAPNLLSYLLHTQGKDLAIVFDGYDEMSEEDRSNSFVASILKREVLPQCDLVVTSRPTASAHLRDIAICRVEVLGFTEENRLDYIKHALQEDVKIEAIQSYLQSNSTINALCYIPLNMTILLTLFADLIDDKSAKISVEVNGKQNFGCLPTNQTEMYKKFILATITRSLKKSKQLLGLPLMEFSDLPNSHIIVFEELCELAFNALSLDQIEFELDKIKSVCPNLTMTSDSWSGLGLLKVAQFVNTVSFHFLHFSIQEYLAAYHIASLSNKAQIKLLKKTFWNIHYFNTWIMYIGITNGANFAWRHFLSCNWFRLSTQIFKASTISKRLLKNKMKCLHLFQCFAEVGGNISVGKSFEGKTIDLSNQNLLQNDINTLGFFLKRSSGTQWKKLDLSNSNIGNIGCDKLYHKFWNNNSRHIVNIKMVDFSNNRLNIQSILLSIELFKCWHTLEAIINEDSIEENGESLFKLVLSELSANNSVAMSLTISVGPYLFVYNASLYNIQDYLRNKKFLCLNNCHWDSKMHQFSTAILRQKLSQIHLMNNSIPPNTISTIVKGIKNVFVCNNTLSSEYMENISDALQWKPNAGKWLLIGHNTILYKVHRSIQCQYLSTTVVLQGLNFNFASAMSLGDYHLFELLLHESKCIFQDIVKRWHKNSMNSFCFVENNILIANGFNSINKVLVAHKHLTSIFIGKCIITVSLICDLIDQQKALSVLYIFDCHLEVHDMNKIYTRYLTSNRQLIELFVHTTNPQCSLDSSLLALLSNCHNTSTVLVTKDTLAGQRPTNDQIVLALRLEPSIKVWKFHYCYVSVETYYHLANTLSSNSVNMELDVSGCDLGICEMQSYLEHYRQGSSSLRTLKFSCNKITEETAGALIAIFSHTSLENLKFKCNRLSVSVTIKILKGLDDISTLTTLSLSGNMINEQAADGIATILLHNTKLKKLDLSYNHLQTRGIIKVLQGMTGISTLIKFNISCNAINHEAADDIADLFSRNTQLQEIDLSYNYLLSRGVIKIAKKIKHIFTLKKLKLSGNMITDEAVNDIFNILSSNITIKELDLSLNYMQSNGIMQIVNGIKTLKLNFSCNIAAKLLDNRNTCNLPQILDSDFFRTVRNFRILRHASSNRESHSTIYNQMLHYLTVVHRTKRIQMKNVISMFKVLDYISNMTKLNISNTDLTIGNVAAALSVCSRIEELNFSHNNLMAISVVQILKSALTIKKLGIYHNKILKPVYESDVGYISSDAIAANHHNTTLQEFYLKYNDLQTLDFINIIKELKDTSTIRTFNVSNNDITEQAACYIASVLSHNSTLEKLDLSCNSLQSAGIIKIMKGLKNISTLRMLNVSNNAIIDEEAENIASVLFYNHSTLQDLNLSHNNLKSAGIIKIMKGMENIFTLKQFNISYNGITDEAASVIATVLSHNSVLEVLDLSFNIFQAEGINEILNAIKEISTLTALNICSNHITDKSAGVIASVVSQNVMLNELCLSNTGLQAAGVVKITEGMKNVSILERLNVSYCNITDEAAHSIASVLSHNTKLVELDLSYTSLQTAGFMIVMSGAVSLNLKRLNVSNNNITDNVARITGTTLCHYTNLEELDLSNTYSQAPGFTALMKGLEGITTLKILRVNKNSITDQAANVLATVLSHNANLEELDLSHTSLRAVDFATLMKGMENISTLKRLNVGSNNITDEVAHNLAMILSHNSNLEELDLSCTSLHTASFTTIMRAMEGTSTLKRLNVSNNNIMEANKYAITNLSNKSTLEELNIGGHHCIANRTPYDFGVFLSHNIHLEVLDISQNGLQAKSIIIILQKLKEMSDIIQINFSYNNISNSALDDIVAFLSHNTKLQVLDLGFNININSSYILRRIKRYILNLIKLTISCNAISDNTAEDIANFLSCNTKLEEVDLSHNYLTAKGIGKICVGLSNVFSLTKLNFSNTFINDKVADGIISVLSHNTNLKWLNLSNTKMQMEGISKISIALRHNPLQLFDIKGNNINDQQAVILNTFLHCDTKLEYTQ